MKSSIVLVLVGCLIWIGSARADQTELARKAQAILKTHCHRCHGQQGSARGGFNYILDRDRLVDHNKIVPGRAADSEIYQRIHKDEMPPAGQKMRPSADELAVLARWIDAGAPTPPTFLTPRDFISSSNFLQLIAADLQTVDARHRRFIRYLTLTHLYNAGRSAEELATARQAVAKLLNSLSWHPRITVPKTIDPAGTILRIDLRDYKWTARSWDRLVAVYPYANLFSDTQYSALSTPHFLRADWFVATASRPPLYHDLLQLPSTDRELERQLRIDVIENINEESVTRAGFNGSGVSRNNRLIERHDAGYGAYWRSYDFSDNLGRQNLFDHPLGPVPGQNSFQHAGGEILFNLPNGLQAYLLVDANGRRIDRAPIEIVSDTKRPDRSVETGLSCMSCHGRGIIPKADQIRLHVEKNPQAFSRADRETVKALHPPEAQLKVLMEEDSQRFLKALEKVGVSPNGPEPITVTALSYEAALDLPTAAAELGLRGDDLVERLSKAPSLARVLGSFRTRGGLVQRQAFQRMFADVVREFRITEDASAGATPLPQNAAIAAERVPFSGHVGKVFSLAFSPDGRCALSAGEDRSVRLWDVFTGRELRCYQGHSEAVLAVAFSADGRHLLSGSADRTLRLWEVETGKELCRLTGHADAVRCVALSPDGRWALSGSADHSVRVWDTETGNELLVFTGHRSGVNSVAFSSDGSRVLSGSGDHSICLWEASSGRLLRRFEGHDRDVFSVAFSADGRQALSAGEDKSIRLWDTHSGVELRRLQGHANAIIRVAFSPDGRRALSGSSQYQASDQTLRLWDLQTGQQLLGLGDKDADGVQCVAFSPDGSQALIANRNGVLRLWRLSQEP